MKRYLLAIVLLAGAAQAAVQTELSIGRAYYADGEFKKAVSHLELALRANPRDAESCYWLGMSYEVLASIAMPFEGRYNSKARAYLSKAVELAPARQEYRRELFDFLVDSAYSSRTALRQARAMLMTLPETDPEYSYLWSRLENETRENSSADARFGRLFLAAPRTAMRIAELPVSVLQGTLTASPASAVR